jgi:hypothetical protein
MVVWGRWGRFNSGTEIGRSRRQEREGTAMATGELIFPGRVDGHHRAIRPNDTNVIALNFPRAHAAVVTDQPSHAVQTKNTAKPLRVVPTRDLVLEA